MHKFHFLILLTALIALNINCTGNKGPVIKIGKTFDNEKIEVSEQTNIFRRNDNFAYTLSQNKPFDSLIITRRFYQGKEYVDMIQKESIDINIKPGTKKIWESIPVEKLIQKYGSGDYLLLFIINDYVIAKQKFNIDEKAILTPKLQNNPIKQGITQIIPEKAAPVMQGNPSTINSPVKNVMNEEIPKERNIPKKQERNMPMSPSEMMR